MVRSRDLTGHIRPGGWWGKGSPVAPGDLDPLLHDLAELAVDLHLVGTVAAGADDPGALADEGPVLLRPLHELHVLRGVRHDWASSIARRTSRSWYGLASSPSWPETM